MLKRFRKRLRQAGGQGRWDRCPRQKVCICPRCDMKVDSQDRVPCYRMNCPNCGIPMARRFFQP